MAAPVTEKFEHMVLEVEFTSGSFTKICGLVEGTQTRTSETASQNVPADCDDESLPHNAEVTVVALGMNVSATGVMSVAAHEKLLDWWYSGQPLTARMRHAAVTTTGNTDGEQGQCVITSYANARTKGNKVTAAIELSFTGLITRNLVS